MTNLQMAQFCLTWRPLSIPCHHICLKHQDLHGNTTNIYKKMYLKLKTSQSKSYFIVYLEHVPCRFLGGRGGALGRLSALEPPNMSVPMEENVSVLENVSLDRVTCIVVVHDDDSMTVRNPGDVRLRDGRIIPVGADVTTPDVTPVPVVATPDVMTPDIVCLFSVASA